MTLRTFWVWHKDEEEPVCEAARTDDLTAEHAEGWSKTKREIRETYGDRLHSEREILVYVEDSDVLRHWFPEAINGNVER